MTEAKTSEEIAQEYFRHFYAECRVEKGKCIDCTKVEELKKTTWLRESKVMQHLDAYLGKSPMTEELKKLVRT